MTKLLVLSDSHANAASIVKALDAEPDITNVLYLGDGMRDLYEVTSERKGLRVYAVAGNCDFYCYEPKEGFAPFEKVLVYYTHGDLYGVKYSMEQLETAAKARQAQVVLFGHTHQKYSQTKDGILYFNPGSCGKCYQGENTYGVITVEDGKVVSAEHKPLVRG